MLKAAEGLLRSVLLFFSPPSHPQIFALSLGLAVSAVGVLANKPQSLGSEVFA